MAPTPLITIVGSLVLAAGIFFGYLALKLAKLVVKNLLARQSVERAGFARPNAPGYSFFKGHVDLFINAGGSFTAMMQWLDRNDPGLPDTFVVYISLFRTLLVTRDPDVAYQVLLKKNYPKDVYESITELVGAGLLTSGGEVWAKKRRIMNAGFKPDFLKTAMVPKFASYAKIMCDAMDRDLEARRGPEKNWVDMAEVLSRVTLDIIGDTAFGHHFNFTTSGDDDDTARIKAMVFTTLSEPSKMLVNPFRKFTHPRQTYHYYQELARFKRMGLEIVRKARVKTTEGKDDGETNILSLILKMGQLSTDDRLSDQEILDEVAILLA